MRCEPARDVIEWRCQRLIEAGFLPVQAMDLARDRVDVHALMGLIDRGCSPALAARILVPTPEGW